MDELIKGLKVFKLSRGTITEVPNARLFSERP